MPIFNEANFDVIQASLSGLDKKHSAISNNLANVDTPGYKREEVNFKAELKKIVNQSGGGLVSTNKRHITNQTQDLSSYQPSVTRREDASSRIDKNNVNIDKEMAKLAKTDLEYQAMNNLLRNNFSKLGTVIDKGGR